MAQRSLWKQIFNNFIKSLKPKNYWGEFRGKDYMGTEYYEAPEKLQGNRPSRWFVPVETNNFEQELPPEWQAWLRHRRKEPPTEEEVQLNMLKMLKTVENAKKLEKPTLINQAETKSIETKFPIYEDYETETGFGKETTNKK